MSNNLLVLDLETSGLNFRNDMICEIGIVNLDTSSGKITPIYNRVVKDKSKIAWVKEDSWIFENSDLTYEEVVNAVDIREITYELNKWLNYGINITAYNQKFDFGFLSYMGLRSEYKWGVDIMRELTPILNIPHHYYGVKYPSVEEAYRFLFEEEYREKHRALQDAEDEAKIIYECIERGYVSI